MISLIIPVRNAEATIEKCLAAAFALDDQVLDVADAVPAQGGQVGRVLDDQPLDLRDALLDAVFKLSGAESARGEGQEQRVRKPEGDGHRDRDEKQGAQDGRAEQALHPCLDVLEDQAHAAGIDFRHGLELNQEDTDGAEKE